MSNEDAAPRSNVDLELPSAPSSSQTQASCPSCGRFVGPYGSCPYCGAQLERRLSLRVVKMTAILLASVGLVALWWAARHMPVPLLTAEEALGTMNLAYVRLQGVVVRSLTYDPKSEYLAFWLDDGTGEVMVSMYRDVTQTLIAKDHVPALGDGVEVAGTLRIREDFLSLTVNVPEHLSLERPSSLPVQARSLTSLDEGRRVVIAGEVRDIFVPYEGLTLITVRDTSGEVPVVVDETLTALTGPLPEIAEGQGVVVTGTVTLYRNEPQLVPASVSEIVVRDTVVEETVVTSRDLVSLTEEDEGAWVRVEGRVVALTGFKGGVKATLDDGTDQLLVLIWSSVHDALTDPEALDVGAEVTVEGEVQLYDGSLEVVPRRATDLQLRVGASAPPWVEIAALTEHDVGRVVRLRGVVSRLSPFSSGLKLLLDDGTGQLTVLLWSNVVEALEVPPEAGQMVEVVGEVAVYQDELELIPRSSHDWRVGP